MTSAFQKYFIVPASGNVPSYVAAVVCHSASGWTPVGVMQAAQTVAVYTQLLDRNTSRAALEYTFPGEHAQRVSVLHFLFVVCVRTLHSNILC